MAITVTDEMKNLFTASETTEEIRTSDGRILGRFTPAKLLMTFPELQMTDEELDRIANNPNTIWHTPEQVMARLREIDNA